MVEPGLLMGMSSPTAPALSVLDLVPVRTGQTSAQAVAASVALAQLADRARLPPLLVRRAPQHAGRRLDHAARADRGGRGAHRADPRRLGRRHAAEPRAARRRRAVRRARGARARAHRPRHRACARQRPGDHAAAAHRGPDGRRRPVPRPRRRHPVARLARWRDAAAHERARYAFTRRRRPTACPTSGCSDRATTRRSSPRSSGCPTCSRTTSRARASSGRSSSTAPSTSRARRIRTPRHVPHRERVRRADRRGGRARALPQLRSMARLRTEPADARARDDRGGGTPRRRLDGRRARSPSVERLDHRDAAGAASELGPSPSGTASTRS